MSADLAPSTETELAQAIAQAAKMESPLEIVGGTSRAGLGRPVQAEAKLCMRQLEGISLYEPGALTLVVKAGTPMDTVETLLAEHGQILPFEPPDHRVLLGTGGTPTIGGAVAVAASGPRRITAGACRDSMIGVRFVDGQGHIIANGGRVMKNVTGYDLVKLMAGAHGTLGVLCEIGFKLRPAPENTWTIVLHRLDDMRATAAMARALTSPYEVTGAAHLPQGPAGEPQTLIRLEGLTASVAYRAEKLCDHLGDFGDIEIVKGTGQARQIWRGIRDMRPLAGGEGAIWRLSMRPSDAPALVARLRDEIAVDGVFYDWGGGLVWLRVPETGDCGASVIRQGVMRMGGHASLIRASATTRAAVEVFMPEPAPLAAISKGLRDRFDPHHILNPGRMRA